MTYQKKAFTFHVKATNDEQGSIEGYLSVFNVVDQGNDRVRKGAFKRTLSNAKKAVKDGKQTYLFPMLWQHDPEQPIGGVTDAYEDDYGLYTVAQFDLDTQKGREAYSGYKKGYLNQLSIGYDPIQKTYDEKGVRDLTEIRLWEQSTVTFAMNEEALVTGVKANTLEKARQQKTMPEKNKNMQKKDFNDTYRTSVIEDWMYTDLSNITSALRQSLMDIFAIGDTPEPDLITTILDDGNGEGLVSALKAWVQKGIDLDVSNYLQELSQNNPYSSYYGGYMSADSSSLARKQVSGKSGGMSQVKKDTIQAHIDTLHDMADSHKAAATKTARAMHSVADDLATVLGGSEAAYGSDSGTPEDGEGEGKSSSPTAPRQHKDHSSQVDTDLDAALARLNRLTAGTR